MNFRSLTSLRNVTRALHKAYLTGSVTHSTSLMRNSAYVTARMLSNSSIRFSAVKEELTAALDNEIEAEKKLENENLGGSSAPSIAGFTLNTNGAEVRLTKTHGSEQILVVFNVNHSVDVDEPEEEYEKAEEAPVPVALPPFSVEITKGNERLCFHLELVEVDEHQYDFRVEEFYVAPAAKDGNEDVDVTVYASSGKYIDPSLHDLLFVRYLEERGFTQDFCQSLVTYATHYEHSQYVRLLHNIKNFVAK
jgi:hypothetical protein